MSLLIGQEATSVSRGCQVQTATEVVREIQHGAYTDVAELLPSVFILLWPFVSVNNEKAVCFASIKKIVAK